MRIALIIFLLVVAVLAAVGLLSSAMLTADRNQILAERQRLALWRLDAAFTAIVVGEAGRDPRTWPALATELPITMRLTIGLNGFTCSAGEGSPEAAALVASAGGWKDLLLNVPDVFTANESHKPTVDTVGKTVSLITPSVQAEAIENQSIDEVASVGNDYVQRSSNAFNYQGFANRNGSPSTPRASVISGPLVSRWIGDQLVLVRRSIEHGHLQAQVAVLSLAALDAQSTPMIADLFPHARLIAARETDLRPDQLAALPLRLEYGEVEIPLSQVARWTLIAAWLGAGLGLAGVLTALIALWRLGERRATFVSAVTHELRTPLTSLRLHADLLADPRIGTDPERRAQRISILRSEADRLAHLVENVLDFARLERRTPTPQALDLPALLHDITPRISERLTVAGLELAVFTPPLCRIAGDTEAISRILVNLADNAAKYAADRTKNQVELRAFLIHRGVELRLRDYGPGVARDVRSRLFIPFSRSSENAAGSAPGVGLGLALCRRLARSMKGDLRLEHPADGGTEAVLFLPLAVRS